MMSAVLHRLIFFGLEKKLYYILMILHLIWEYCIIQLGSRVSGYA